MRWAGLPERYGKYKSVHKRFLRWAERGVWDRLFDDLVADRKNPYLMLDSTIVQAHQQAATGRKRGRRQGAGAFPRWTEHKNSSAGNGLGEPVAFRLTGGQAGEFAEALPLLAGRRIQRIVGIKVASIFELRVEAFTYTHT